VTEPHGVYGADLGDCRTTGGNGMRLQGIFGLFGVSFELSFEFDSSSLNLARRINGWTR
jgi:hypothetical protein